MCLLLCPVSPVLLKWRFLSAAPSLPAVNGVNSVPGAPCVNSVIPWGCHLLLVHRSAWLWAGMRNLTRACPAPHRLGAGLSPPLRGARFPMRIPRALVFRLALSAGLCSCTQCWRGQACGQVRAFIRIFCPCVSWIH